MKTCRIAMAGLDTSHVPAFAELLHDTSHPFHVSGGRIVAAFPGGSPDFALSINRVKQFTTDLQDKHGVEIVDSLSELRGKCDALMLESIDGRIHLSQFREAAEWGIPVFIDKPLTVSAGEAQDIVTLAAAKKVRVTSASSLRFSETFQLALEFKNKEPVCGADCYGPIQLQEKCPGFFWYGIHSAEMLFAAMGTGCSQVWAVREGNQDVVVGRWQDGRLGTLRGNRDGNNNFGGTIHRKSGTSAFDASRDKKSSYASLLEKVIPFFHGESEVVAPSEMVEVIRFLEAANESLASGKWVELKIPA